MSQSTKDMNNFESIARLVHRTHRFFCGDINSNFTEAGFDINDEQWHILRSLWKKDGQTQQSLSIDTERDKATITRLINSLEKKDLVVRVPNQADSRSNLIYLTHGGKKLRADLESLVQKILNRALAGIPAENVVVCKSVLSKILQNLGYTSPSPQK